MSKKHMPKIKFLAIAADIIADKSGEVIASKHRVSVSTVSRINHFATYGNYLAGKQANKPLRSHNAPRKKLTLAEKKRLAEKAGLKPVTREERLEKKLAEQLQFQPGVVYWKLPKPEDSKKSPRTVLLERVQNVEQDLARTNRALIIVAIVLSVLGLIGVFN